MIKVTKLITSLHAGIVVVSAVGYMPLPATPDLGCNVKGSDVIGLSKLDFSKGRKIASDFIKIEF